MKFTIGDRVLIKRTGEEGTLLSFLGKQLVEVEVDGVAFPVYADEVDHPYLAWFSAQPVGRRKPVEEIPVEKTPPPRPPQGLHLSFLPVYKSVAGEDVVDLFKIHLLNETPYTVRFRYVARGAKNELFSLRGELQPFSNLYLHSLDFETVSATPRYLWWAQPVEGAKQGPAFDGEVRIRPPRLFQYLQRSLREGDPTFHLVLRENFVEAPPLQIEAPIVITGLPQGAPRRWDALPVETLVPRIIDLHLGALLDEGETLPREEALPLQLRVLRAALEDAVAAGARSLTVIHGLGRGSLRAAVHTVLRGEQDVTRFSDGWHPRYGFGATEVWFA